MSLLDLLVISYVMNLTNPILMALPNILRLIAALFGMYSNSMEVDRIPWTFRPSVGLFGQRLDLIPPRKIL